MVHCWKTIDLDFVNTLLTQAVMSAVTDLGWMQEYAGSSNAIKPIVGGRNSSGVIIEQDRLHYH